MAASLAVDITYVPADCGSIIPGKSKAPKAFRDVNLSGKLLTAGIPSVSEHEALESPATWAGDDSSRPGPIRNESLNISVCQQVQRTLAKTLNNEKRAFQLIIGGECCMVPAIMSAFWESSNAHQLPKRIGLLYIDANTDLETPPEEGSIAFASMNMAHLLGVPGALPAMKQFSRPSGEPVCDPSNTVFFGINMAYEGNKREHFAYLFDNNIKVVSSSSIARNPEERAREALKYLEERVDVILVHLDVDAIDPLNFPLANVPNFTGIDFEAMMRALSVVLRSEKIGGLVVAEVNPDHDPGLKMTEKLTNSIVGMLAARGQK